MNAPYDENLVASLMLTQQLSRKHAVNEAIWTSASDAVERALAQALANAQREKPLNLSRYVRYLALNGRGKG